MFFKWIIRGINIAILAYSFEIINSISSLFSFVLTNSAINRVLIKKIYALEKLSKANIYIFEKSGTLTKGNYEVTNVFPQKKKKILKLASHAEFNFSYPIAQAILKAYFAKINKDYKVKYYDGLGVVASDEKKEIICENEKLMDEKNIKYTKNLAIGTYIYVAVNKKF